MRDLLIMERVADDGPGVVPCVRAGRAAIAAVAFLLSMGVGCDSSESISQQSTVAMDEPAEGSAPAVDPYDAEEPNGPGETVVVPSGPELTYEDAPSCCPYDDALPLEMTECGVARRDSDEFWSYYFNARSGTPRERNGDRGDWWMERWTRAAPSGSAPCTWYRGLLSTEVRQIVNVYPEQCARFVSVASAIPACGLSSSEIGALRDCGDRAGAHDLLCEKLRPCAEEHEYELLESIYGCTPPEQEPAP